MTNKYCNEDRMCIVMGALGRNRRLFNMENWRSTSTQGLTVTGKHTCGTAMCIGGTAEAIVVAEGSIQKDQNYYDIGDPGDTSTRVQAVIKWLGMDQKVGRLLFYPHVVEDIVDWKRITVQMAQQAMINVITTGEPDWETVTEELQDA